MKKAIVTLLISLFSILSYSQQPKDRIDKNVLHTSIKNGVGKYIPLHFPLLENFITELKSCADYKSMVSDTVWMKNNIGDYKGDTVLLVLSNKVMFAGTMLKFELKNSTSFSAPEDAEGIIYVNDEGKIVVSFPITGQNGYGNTVIKKGLYNGKIALIMD